MVFAAFAIVSGAQFSAHAAAKETTVADLRLIEDKFRSLDVKNEKATQDLILSASQAVKAMPVHKNQKLDQIQIKELVQLLRAAGSADSYNRIVDDNSEMIAANQKEIRLELKKLAPKEAKTISDTIDIVLSGEKASDYVPAKHEK